MGDDRFLFRHEVTMSYLSVYSFSFDRSSQTFYAQGAADFPYYDPSTGEDLSDWRFSSMIDGYNVGSGYGFGYMSFTAFNDYVSSGTHTISVTAYNEWTGQALRWTAELVNDTLARAGRYYVGTTGTDIYFGGGYDDDIYLGSGNDFAEGGAGSDLLDGGSGVDELRGGSGADFIRGGTGADGMWGDTGNDTFYVDNAQDKVFEDSGEGYDLIYTSVSYALAAGEHIEGLRTSNDNGTASINLTGNELANTLVGNAGANILNGRAGADRMFGFGGDDTYIVDNAGDTVTETAGNGVDLVNAYVTHTLSANVEILSLEGSASINGIGNELANTILGNGGANILNGRAGADRMSGYGGNDTYIVDNASDVVRENAGSGIDTVQTAVSRNLDANVERMTLLGTANLNAGGNSLANVIVGNSGANRLNGGTGSDTLTGGQANDIFVFNSALGASNIDTITDYSNPGGNNDTIWLENSIFTALTATGVLASAAFKNLDLAAADSSDRILYDQDHGDLYYDRDGSGTAYSAIKIAEISNFATLTYTDFSVI
jgi:Ca2+-binding RTX toxin-like protein